MGAAERSSDDVTTRAAFVLLALGLNSCLPLAALLGVEAPAPAATPSEDTGLPFITTQEAEKSGFLADDTRVPLEEKDDATKLLMDSLVVAKGRGAVAVGEVAIVLPKGDRQECRSLITSENALVAHTVPAETRLVSTPQLVTRQVTEMQYQCRYVSRPHTQTQTSYESEYDYSSKRTRQVTRSKLVTVYRSEQECNYSPVERMVTRYDYQLQSHFVPPSTEYLSERRLNLSEPVCYEITKSPRSHMELRLYRRP
jgi:hypothetical protein